MLQTAVTTSRIGVLADIRKVKLTNLEYLSNVIWFDILSYKGLSEFLNEIGPVNKKEPFCFLFETSYLVFKSFHIIM